MPVRFLRNRNLDSLETVRSLLELFVSVCFLRNPKFGFLRNREVTTRIVRFGLFSKEFEVGFLRNRTGIFEFFTVSKLLFRTFRSP
jgi:hypothetical protein